MASLTNTKIKDTYDGLLKTTDNDALGGTYKLITDGLGNSSGLYLGTGGRIGLGTSSPSDNLEVNGAIRIADQYELKFGGTTASIFGSSSLNQLRFYTNNSERLRIDSSGNVGIGTSSPDSILTLNGSSSSRINLRTSETRYGTIFSDSGLLAIASITSIPIVFAINDVEKMRLDSSGNLGLGTSSPSANLHISGTSDVGLRIKSGASSLSYIDFDDADSGTPSGSIAYNNIVDAMTFATGGSNTERMRIDSSGNVGIGTSSPSSLMHISKSTSPAISNSDLQGIKLTNTSTSFGGSGIGIELDAGNGDVNAMIAVRADGNDNSTEALFIATTTSDPIIFATNSGGTDITTNERMRITSGGNLLVATTSTDGTITCTRNGNTYNFSATSDANNTTEGFFRGYSTAAGANRIIIYSNGNIVNSNNSYGAISDAKLKENVTDASPKLDDLMQVQVRNFNYIGEDKKQIGVVAQELEDVFPSMIDESTDFEEQEVTDEDGNVTKEKVDLGTTTKSVKYSVFVPILIKAIQELKAEIETLKSQINS